MMIDVVQQVGAQGSDARLTENLFPFEGETPAAHSGLLGQSAEQLFGGVSVLLEGSANFFYAVDGRRGSAAGRKLVRLDDSFRHPGDAGNVHGQLTERA